MINSNNLPHKSGIYKIENLINKKVYIGQSKDIYKRYHNHHKSDCYNNKSPSYNFQIYQAIRKYGEENFSITVLELCDLEELDEKEIFWIKYYDSFKNGYNATEGGQFWTPSIHSKEIEMKRRIIREKNQSLKGQNHPRAKLPNSEVILIRQRYIDGETVEQIYKDYKEIYNNILVFKRIIFGQSYKEVGNIPNKENIRYTNSKLTIEQVKEIRYRYENENVSYAKLAKEYLVSSSSISNIIQRKTYKHVK